ncbi:hypothetical protein IM538_03855 [Cytobacillus suaedae]|nr:hypothetical protein IM538_03855 [Cytobacillus suaedae]
MGSSFSSVHIKISDLELVKESLTLLHKEKVDDNIIVMGKYKYFYCKSKEWITLLNEMYDGYFLDFATILSKYLSAPMLVIECFDESNLEMNFIQNGVVLAKHNKDDEDDFDITEVDEDITSEALRNQWENSETIIKSFDLKIHENELNKVFELNDIEETISLLEELLKIDIWVKVDWIEDDEELKSKFISLTFEE